MSQAERATLRVGVESVDGAEILAKPRPMIPAHSSTPTTRCGEQVGAGERSGGSTPTAALADDAVLTELRPGVYVFNDAQQVELGAAGWNDAALMAASTVISRSRRRVVLDAGSKALGADRPAWTTGGGRLLDHPHARITALSEHHATVVFAEGEVTPDIGSVLRVVPNHVCSAVNLTDELVICTGDAVTDRWQVAARGRND